MRNSIVSFVVIAGLILVSVWYVYATYYEEIYDWLGIEIFHTIFIDEVFFSVSIADTPAERQQGLSGTPYLADQTGMLFVFDEPGRYGMWMKNMRYAIDIIWIDESFKVVHIEENVAPDSYPKTFSSPGQARFVLEVPAFTAKSFKIDIGEKLYLPVDITPKDLQNI